MKVSESPRAVGRLALTERDRRLLGYLARFRLLSRNQVMALAGFASITRANTRLASLVASQLIARKALPYYPGHGSAQALYLLLEAASSFLDRPVLSEEARRIRRWDFRQATHTLIANEVLIDLFLATERSAEFRTEPELRQVFASRNLVPDGWLAWRAEGKRFNCFIEVDLHTEGLGVWRDKVMAYLQYAESGLHLELFGFRFFRVAVLAQSKKRLENLRSIGRTAGRLFVFAEQGLINRSTVLGSSWRSSSGELLSLSDG